MGYPYDSYGIGQDNKMNFNYAGPGLPGSVRDNALTNAFGMNTPGTNNGGTGLFGMSNNAWGNIGTLGQIGGAIGSWMMGNKALDQAQEKFEFQKDSWEKQFAMMQDQYYRKLNNRRANRYATDDMSWDERLKLAENYDSGSNLTGAYDPNAASQNGAPTVANANTMNQATGGAPFSVGSAQGMLNAGDSKFNDVISKPYGTAPYAQPAPSLSPTTPSVPGSINGGREIIRRKKVKPNSQSGNNTNTDQLSNG